MKRLLSWLVLSLTCAGVGCFSQTTPQAAPSRDASAQAGTKAPSRVEPAGKLARNVIVFMGDGMGPEQLSTGRYARDGAQRLELLNGPAFVNTDSLSTLSAPDPELAATDSAAAATAIATGVRVIDGALSLTGSGEVLETVLEACKSAGKATGLVTTSFFFDASPAAFAVHQPRRDMHDAIVRQMLAETQPDVIMGNDLRLFEDPQYQEVADAAGYFVVRGAAELLAWDPVAQPRMLGLFATDFMPLALAVELYSMTPALERRAESPDPSLAMMTERALERLASAPEGFFLFAEDELLDEMGHRGPAEVEWVNRAYPEQVAALDAAVGVAIDWVLTHSSFEETLIVLLADHETGGYHYDHEIGPESGSFSAFSEADGYLVGNHTRTPTAVYALGPGSDLVFQLHEHGDTHRLLIGALQ